MFACSDLRLLGQRDFKSSFIFSCSSSGGTGQSPAVNSNMFTFFCISLLAVKWAYESNREMTVVVQFPAVASRDGHGGYTLLGILYGIYANITP